MSTSVTIPSVKPPAKAPTPPAQAPKEETSSPADLTPTSPARELEATKGSVVYSKKHVIVNTANQWLAPGEGVSREIFDAAGADEVLASVERRKNTSYKNMDEGPALLKTSEIFLTRAYNLYNRGTLFIIHALGPDFRSFPYSSSFETGYTALRTTYQNIYHEMNQLNKIQKVTTIGVIPISAGVFAGRASKEQMYRIMIEETLDAMDKYPAIQPELYLHDDGEYNTVKSLLSTIVKEKYPSVGTASLSAGTAAAVLALNSNQFYQTSIVSGYIKGSAHNFGPIRLIGLNSSHQHRYTNTAFVGVPLKQHMVGVELELEYHGNELTHYAVKAKGIYQFSPEICFGGGVGYVSTNLSLNALNTNMRQFLNHLGIIGLSERAITAEIATQYQKDITENAHLTTTIGFQIKFAPKTTTLPFVQASLNIGQFKSNVLVSMEDIGLNLELNN